jgi:hypothetical protein
MRSILLLAFVSMSACSSSEAAPNAPDASSSDAREVVLDPNGCTPLTDELPGAICIRTLRARVVDDRGAPLPELVVTACGDGCTFGATDARGDVVMDVRRYMRSAAMMVHGRAKYASFYLLFPSGSSDPDLGTVVAPALPPGTEELPTDGRAADRTFGDLTLSFAEGAKVEVDGIEFSEGPERRFSAVEVPKEKAPRWAAGDFAAVYALNPFGTNVDPGASVTIANTKGLPAGSKVEIFVHGADVFSRVLPFADFTKVGEGTVSADGATITSDGAIVRQLTWIGVRAIR